MKRDYQREEVEEIVIGMMLLDSECIPECLERIAFKDFQYDRFAEIFAAIVHIHVTKEPVDLITLTMTLKERGVFEKVGGAVALMELIDAVPSIYNVLEFIKMLGGKKSASN